MSDELIHPDQIRAGDVVVGEMKTGLLRTTVVGRVEEKFSDGYMTLVDLVHPDRSSRVHAGQFDVWWLRQRERVEEPQRLGTHVRGNGYEFVRVQEIGETPWQLLGALTRYSWFGVRTAVEGDLTTWTPPWEPPQRATFLSNQ